MRNHPTRRLYVSGSELPRPQSRRTIFCDGGVDSSYRAGVDLELSHWIPNLTPERFKASTSTEICMKYVESTDDRAFDLVINNHVDVDGVLSTFVLLYPRSALVHRTAIVQAAEMGDFGGWGEPHAQHICQSLLCLISRLEEGNTDRLEIYLQCHERVHDALAGERFAECEPGMAALQRSIGRIEDRSIRRTPITSKFVHYAIPRELAEGDIDSALHAPRFNAPLSSTAFLPPNARARYDSQKVHLVSVAMQDGHYYDLWYPGYIWADTVNLWLAPGVQSTGSSNVHRLNYPALQAATNRLQQMETAVGTWILARELSPFGSVEGRSFPIVTSFMRDGEPRTSTLTPSFVAETLAPLFTS